LVEDGNLLKLKS